MTEYRPIFSIRKCYVIKIIAYDQASSLSGVAVFEDDKLIKYDLIDLHKDKNMEHRVCNMMKILGKYIIDNMPDYVIFEGVSLQTNVSTLLLLAQIQGAIMQTCVMNNIPFIVYKPTQWRKALKFNQGKNVKRPELKQQAKDYVYNKYGLKLKEDLCDAICIGEAFIIENKKED